MHAPKKLTTKATPTSRSRPGACPPVSDSPPSRLAPVRLVNSPGARFREQLRQVAIGAGTSNPIPWVLSRRSDENSSGSHLQDTSIVPCCQPPTWQTRHFCCPGSSPRNSVHPSAHDAQAFLASGYSSPRIWQCLHHAGAVSFHACRQPPYSLGLPCPVYLLRPDTIGVGSSAGVPIPLSHCGRASVSGREKRKVRRLPHAAEVPPVCNPLDTRGGRYYDGD